MMGVWYFYIVHFVPGALHFVSCKPLACGRVGDRVRCRGRLRAVLLAKDGGTDVVRSGAREDRLDQVGEVCLYETLTDALEHR